MCNTDKIVKKECKMLYNRVIGDGIYEMLFDSVEIAEQVKPGQFINLYTDSDALLLPRPISICEVNKSLGVVKIVYAALGQGTKMIAKLDTGDTIKVLGPLGNGFPIEKRAKTIIVGGGVGTPPLVELAKNLDGEVEIYLGFRTAPYLVKDFAVHGNVFVATDDGSFGFKGNVVELMEKNGAIGDVLYSCGPTPMLKGVQQFAKDNGIEAYLSLEERMGCGFGACVGCVCKVASDNEAGFTYKKVCKDGPVFNAKEVLLD